MNKQCIQRFMAYESFIELESKATLNQLVKWTASNKFMTLKYLDEIIKLKLIRKVGHYYKLNKDEIENWYIR